MKSWGVTRAIAALAVCAWMTSCTTSLTPVACNGGAFTCNQRRDVRFCEREATEVQGADCPSVRLAPGQRFCVVVSSASNCASTSYEVRGMRCKVVDYRAVQEGAECSAGTPTFNP